MTNGSRAIGSPEPGFFRVRLVRGGPYVAARIFLPCPIDPDFGHYMDRSRHLMAEINGSVYASLLRVFWVWTTGQPVSAGEFQYLADLAAWCRHNDSRDPMANPRKPIDPRKTRPAF